MKNIKTHQNKKGNQIKKSFRKNTDINRHLKIAYITEATVQAYTFSK